MSEFVIGFDKPSMTDWGKLSILFSTQDAQLDDGAALSLDQVPTPYRSPAYTNHNIQMEDSSKVVPSVEPSTIKSKLRSKSKAIVIPSVVSDSEQEEQSVSRKRTRSQLSGAKGKKVFEPPSSTSIIDSIVPLRWGTKSRRTAEDKSKNIAGEKSDQFSRGCTISRDQLYMSRVLQSSKRASDIDTIPSNLDMEIQKYCWMFALSPVLKKYRIQWGPILFASMYNAGISQLPTWSSNAGTHLAVFYAKIDHSSTQILSEIKQVIEQSLGFYDKRKIMTPAAPSWHITTVARTLTAKYSGAVTTELLQHLALLRAIYHVYRRMCEKDDFWTYVDGEICNYTEKYQNQEDQKEWLCDILELDMTDFPRRGDGSDSFDLNAPITVPYDKVSDAQKIVDRHIRHYVSMFGIRDTTCP